MSGSSDGVDLRGLAEQIAGRAESGEQLEAYVARGVTTSVRAYEGEVEEFTSASSAGVGIRVVSDQRQGFAHGGSLEPDVIDEVLAEARDNARFAEPDEHVGLAEPDGVPPPDLPESVTWREGLADYPTASKIELALELERRVRAGDPRITGVRSAGYGDGSGEAAVASSTGISVWGRGTSCSLGVSALAEDGDDTQIGGGSSVAREPVDLEIEEAAAEAIERATRLLGATQPASETVTIVLEPRLAASLVAIIGGTLSGERLIRGRTPFADRIGEAIGSPLLTLADDATDLESFGADRHDGEGLATRRTSLITAGVLDAFLDNAYTARHRGTTSTASAVRGYRSRPGVGAQALFVEPGDRSPADLIGEVDRGLVVQSLTGLHSGVNAVSGDFSVGADGLLISDGEEMGPVREVTLASTLQRMLLDIVAVGDDLERRPGGTSVPTLVIDGVMMSGRWMSILHAIILGITQGLTEFFPISSSGHLALVPWVFGWDDFGDNDTLAKAFDVALHLGTLVGAVAYFRKDLWRYFKGGMAAVFRRDEPVTEDGRIAWLLVLSAVPAAVIGAGLNSAIETLDDEFWLIGVMLIVFALVLYWADHLEGQRKLETFSVRDALFMGLGQSLALQPGVSRSGVTISVGRWLGLDRDAAARISFLMSLPVIAGAGLFQFAKVQSDGGIPTEFLPPFLWGMVAAGVSGWVAVWFTLRWVRTHSFTPFVVYRIALGIGVLILAGSTLR